MDEKLNSYLIENYPDVRNDLYGVIVDKANDLCRSNGYYSLIVQNGIMFLTGFKVLREKMLNNQIVSLIHLGARAFDEIGGEVVQTCTFTIRKQGIFQTIEGYIND